MDINLQLQHAIENDDIEEAEVLLKQNADMSWGNLLTEKVETSADGKTWTLTLKPDLKFSDGSPLTAEDVVFTYNKAAKSGGKIDMGAAGQTFHRLGQKRDISRGQDQAGFTRDNQVRHACNCSAITGRPAAMV